MEKHHNYAENPLIWLNKVSEIRGHDSVQYLQSAVNLYSKQISSLLNKGLAIADILLSLGLDNETLAATIAYPALQANEIHLDTIIEYFGESSRKLLSDAMQMQSLGKFQHLEQRTHPQIENLRKMLLAMVTDVRAVLIVLAERLWELREAKQLDKPIQQKLAQETSAVYAPLANRLGIWQLKWEIEDLCLRYLEPDIYTNIARSLASRRVEREAYIQRMIVLLTQILQQSQIQDFQISGRVKHIYSIYKKMQRKGADFEKIYDISALRVLVPKIDDCYSILGILQEKWQQVHEEFDDYISKPKPNNYRSIHTVILGPENRYVEIQIRTFQMHEESELGVAAHWRYKEGVLQPSTYEAKIALLRQVMAWQKEVAASHIKSGEPQRDLFAERIYVFTPIGDIVDLPQGATPLDFAYHIHSEVGHRCRGAKINGKMVPMTHELQTGERVEIITTKIANPSRDWLNPHLGYLKTPRARAKVLHWFRVNDVNKEMNEEREQHDQHEKHAKQQAPSSVPVKPIETHAKPLADIQILGINNLLTNIARCCKPLPGDSIIGYITHHHGINIHRKNCINMIKMAKEQQHRLIAVDWGKKHTGAYSVELILRAMNNVSLVRDINSYLAGEKIKVLALQIHEDLANEIDIFLTIEIGDIDQLQKSIDKLHQIYGVISVKRR